MREVVVARMVNGLNHQKVPDVPFLVSECCLLIDPITNHSLARKFLLHVLELGFNQVEQFVHLLIEKGLQVLPTAN